jgi:hypothetical protein
VAWRDVALFTIGPNSRMHAYTGKTSNQRPSSTRSGYEITHLCVSKAGVLKKGAWTDRLSITLPSCSSKFRRYRHLWGKRSPSTTLLRGGLSTLYHGRPTTESLADAGFGRSNCLLARSSPIHPQHTRRPRSKTTTTTTLEYTKSSRRCIPLMRASDGRSLRRGG